MAPRFDFTGKKTVPLEEKKPSRLEKRKPGGAIKASKTSPKNTPVAIKGIKETPKSKISPKKSTHVAVAEKSSSKRSTVEVAVSPQLKKSVPVVVTPVIVQKTLSMPRTLTVLEGLVARTVIVESRGRRKDVPLLNISIGEHQVLESYLLRIRQEVEMLEAARSSRLQSKKPHKVS